MGRDDHRSTLTSPELLEAIVENIPNMIFVKDAETLSFKLFNRAGEQLLGMNRDTLLGKNDYDFFPEADAAFFQAKDRETLASGNLVDIPEEPLETKGGRRWLHTRKVPIRDPDGKPVYLLGISDDITERKERDTALEEAKTQAEAASAELEAFAYSVAHDLRAPLRGIDGFSQALLEDYGDKLDTEGKRYLDNVRSAAQRMALLIDDLLALSRATRTELVREKVDVKPIIDRIVERLRLAEPSREVEVRVTGPLEIEADRRLAAVVFENLVENAWKFTSKRTTALIEIESVSVGDDQAIVVRDNGAGFDMRFKDKLFGAFQRLHAAHEFGGTGIGLATVARIARRHGGRVWAEGEVDRGAAFYVVLGPSRGTNDQR
jgi:PAS domain S-box-containing protein